MRDIKPDHAEHMRYIEQTLMDAAQKFGYQEIRFPIIEKASLFQKSIGIETDIIGQEMYAFSDKSETEIALRPEGTAGCLRSCLSNSLIQRDQQKLFYTGSMFRRERPQKGRYREFTQFGVEVFGFKTGLIDVELINLTHTMWKSLNIKPTLTTNFIGSAETRSEYRNQLLAYWKTHQHQLTDAEQQRMLNNPLRLLDSKNPDLKPLIQAAPKIIDCLSKDELACYQLIKSQLDALNIKYHENPYLVRGLDYYSHFIFEWISTGLGAQDAICGGGRYDMLTKQMGCETSATGFAIGIDRLAELVPPAVSNHVKVFVCSPHQDTLHTYFHELSAIQSNKKIMLYIDMSCKKVKNIEKHKEKGFTHTLILFEEAFKLVNHGDGYSKRNSLDTLLQTLKDLPSTL